MTRRAFDRQLRSIEGPSPAGHLRAPKPTAQRTQAQRSSEGWWHGHDFVGRATEPNGLLVFLKSHEKRPHDRVVSNAAFAVIDDIARGELDPIICHHQGDEGLDSGHLDKKLGGQDLPKSPE